MEGQIVSYTLSAHTTGLQDLAMFRSELQGLKELQGGFRADMGFGQQQRENIKATRVDLSGVEFQLLGLTDAIKVLDTTMNKLGQSSTGAGQKTRQAFQGVDPTIADTVRSVRTLLTEFQSGNIKAGEFNVGMQKAKATLVQLRTENSLGTRELQAVSAALNIVAKSYGAANSASSPYLVGLKAQRAAMNEVKATSAALNQEILGSRRAWQEGKIDSEQLAQAMTSYGIRANALLAPLEAQKAAILALGVPTKAQSLELERLTGLTNGYSLAAQRAAAGVDAARGVITRGSLAAGVQAGTASLSASLRQATADTTRLMDAERAGLITKEQMVLGLADQTAAHRLALTGIEAEMVALRGLGVLDVQQTERLAQLATAQNGYTAALARTVAAQQAQANAQRAAAGAALGMRGAGGMNNAAMAAMFVSPELGMAAIALSMGPVIAAAAAVGLFAKAIGDGIDKAAIFQRSLTQIGALTHQSSAEMNVFGSYVQKLSTDLPLTTQQLLELGRQAVLVGLHGSEGIKTYTENMAGLSIVLRDVNGHSADTAAVGQEVVKVLRSMGADTAGVNQQFAGAVNSLVSLKTQFGAQVPEITNLAKYWSSYAHEIGLSTDQVFGWSAALVSVGARAQGAGGSLQKFFQKLASDASEGSEGMGQWAKVMHMTADEALNLVKTDPSAFLKRFIESLPNFMRDGKDSTAVLKEFGLVSNQVTRAFSELGTSTKNVDKALKDAKDGINDTGLSLRTAMAATRDYKDQQILLTNAFDAFKTNLGQGVTPAMSAVLAWLLDMSKAGLNLSQYLNGTLGAGEINIGNLGSADQADLQLTLKTIDSLKERSDAAGKALLAQAQAHLEVLKKMAAGTWSGPTPWEKATGIGAANSNVVAATLTATGNHEADDLIGWCARWVKLTLEKAQPNAKAEIDRWFGGDANDVRTKLMASGKLQSFNGDAKTLNPGDVVVYNKDKNGDGHIGIYIGEINGRPTVRGNNELGGRDGAAITNEGLTSLGSIAGIVRAADAASGFSSAKVGGPTKTPPVAPPAPAYTGDSGANGSTALSFKTLQTEFTKLTADYKQGKISLDIYHAGMEAVRSKADQLAGTQKTGGKEWNATERLVIKASNAMNSHAKSTEQAALTWAQWTKNRSAALSLAQRESDLDAGKLSDKQVLQVKADLQTYRKDPVQALALDEAERQLKAKVTRAGQADQLRQQESARQVEAANFEKNLNRQTSDAAISTAQSRLKSLEAARDATLQSSKKDAATQLQIEREKGQGILTVQLDILDKQRKQAVQAAHDTAEASRAAADKLYKGKTPQARLNEIKGLETSQVAAANSNYTTDAAAARSLQDKRIIDVKARVQSEAEKAETDRRAREKEAQAITQALRVQDVEKATGHLDALKRLRDAALKDAGDNVSKQLDVQKQYAAGIQAGAEAIANAQFKIDKAAALSGPAQLKNGAMILAKQKRDAALAVARDTSSVDTATEKQVSAVQSVRTAYTGIADTLRQSIQDGNLDAAARQKVVKALNDQHDAALKLGVLEDKNLVPARDTVRNLLAQADAAYLTTQRNQGMISGNSQAAETALAVAESLTSVGERGPAIELLNGILSGLMDSAARGEAAAADIDKVRTALNGLTDAQANETQAQDFLAGLTGTIDEQLAAVQSKLEDPNTSAGLRKAISEMAQDLGSSVTSGATGEAAAEAIQTRLDEDLNPTLDSLEKRVKVIMADNRDPTADSGLIQYLDAVIARGGEAGRVAKDFKDNLDNLVNTLAAPSLAAVLSNPEAYLDGAHGADGIANTGPGESVTKYLQGQVDQQFTDGLKKLSDGELTLAASQATAADHGEELVQILTEQKRRADEAVQSISKLAAIDLQGQTNTLEFQHGTGLVTEAQYIDKKQELQRQAAWQTWQDAQKAHGDMKVATAQLWADLLKADQDGIAARKTLAEMNRAADLTAANAHATNMLALQRSNAAADLTFQHSQGNVSDRGLIDGEQAQAEQVAMDKYLDAFNTAGSDMVLAWDTYQAEMTAASRKGVADRMALDKAGVDSLVSGLQSIGGVLGQLDGMAGLFGKTLTGIGTGVQMLQKMPDLMSKTNSAMKSGNVFDMAGAVGGWLGMASEAIGLISGIGDAIMNLSPAYQAWKKNLLDVAAAETTAMGSKTFGNIANPYYDALKKDSEALTTKANAGWLQQLAWGIFGGAPAVLSKAASDSLIKSSTLFSDYAQSINSSLESELMNAFDNADFTGVQDSLDKMFGKLEASIALKALISKSNLGRDIQKLVDDTTAGLDTTASRAAVKADEASITSQFQAIAPSFAGYGASATSTSTSTAGTTAFGSVPQSVQLAISTPLMDFVGIYDIATKRFDSSTLRDEATSIRNEAVVARFEAALAGRSGNSSNPTLVLR